MLKPAACGDLARLPQNLPEPYPVRMGKPLKHWMYEHVAAFLRERDFHCFNEPAGTGRVWIEFYDHGSRMVPINFPNSPYRSNDPNSTNRTTSIAETRKLPQKSGKRPSPIFRICTARFERRPSLPAKYISVGLLATFDHHLSRLF